MIDEDDCPKIITDFDLMKEGSINTFYHQATKRSLKKLLVRHFPDTISDNKIDYQLLRSRIYPVLPFFSYSEFNGAPSSLSFFLLTKYRANAFKFFFDMVSNWLVPGHRLDVNLFYAVDFRIPELDEEKYTFVEVMLNVHSDYEYEEIMRNLPTMETELRLGVGSSYYARRILETKGLVADQKTALIQEHIANLVKRLPEHFDHDVFTEMQHVLVLCRESFKSERDSRHLSRIISLNYLFRKSLLEAIKVAPEKRHLNLKLFQTRLRLRNTKRRVLGLLVGVNFMSDKEIFEERHLMKAVHNYLPHVQMVEGSFFSSRRAMDHIGILYLEVEKADGSSFSLDEVARLREDLPDDLKDRIEHMMHPVFMPRNEEEIMRNILSLSHQIKYIRDMPQVFISFDEQTFTHLYFTIIHVRVVGKNDKKIDVLFKQADTFLEYIHDFSKTVGYIRKRYPKEATVFRVKLPKDMFLRDDHSIDLYKARQVVVAELERVLDKIRDYNGGMITKQNELLGKVRHLLAEEGVYNDLLLENFFYSLAPASMRSVFEASCLKTLFLLMLDTLEHGVYPDENYAITVNRELESVYVIIIADAPGAKDEMNKALSTLNIPPTELGTVYVNASGTPCLGYIYCCDDPYKQEHFCGTIHHVLETWSQSQVVNANKADFN
ncbi:MAG: hypothetical protein K940chlam3_00500 [Chlamydiae bacterium]|nr:hypothetical protein [Chlamydiota bacterium]